MRTDLLSPERKEVCHRNAFELELHFFSESLAVQSSPSDFGFAKTGVNKFFEININVKVWTAMLKRTRDIIVAIIDFPIVCF